MMRPLFKRMAEHISASLYGGIDVLCLQETGIQDPNRVTNRRR